MQRAVGNLNRPMDLPAAGRVGERDVDLNQARQRAGLRPRIMPLQRCAVAAWLHERVAHVERRHVAQENIRLMCRRSGVRLLRRQGHARERAVRSERIADIANRGGILRRQAVENKATFC